MSSVEGTCPLGGQWWTCQAQSPSFLGCCLSNPCNGIGCPANNLTAAGMGTGSGPDASTNDSSYYPNVNCPNGGTWYTCSAQTPSFQGCCDDSDGFNPCRDNGCPTTRLYAAAFKTVPATMTSATSSATSSSSATPASGASNQKLSIGAIVGCALGGVAVVLIILLGIFFLRRRQKRAGMARSSEPDYQSPHDMSMVKATPLGYEANHSNAKVPTKGNRPVSHTPSSPPHSPAPPYQSPLHTPGLSDHYEIDSMPVHEVESPPIQQWSFISQPRAVEMPDNSGDVWRSSLPHALTPEPPGK